MVEEIFVVRDQPLIFWRSLDKSLFLIPPLIINHSTIFELMSIISNCLANLSVLNALVRCIRFTS